MILTGTQNGVPTFTAHNANMVDMPISYLISTHNALYMLDFVHNYNMYVDYGNLTYHKRRCSVCHDYYLENHTWTLASKSTEEKAGHRVLFECIYCGATMTGDIRAESDGCRIK